ncbi:hypothetical protein MCELHM10_03367 [Paracoccaceae bacterium]|jgi:hypothetical protein
MPWGARERGVKMIKNEMERVFALTMGSVLVLAVSGCAFSGPGTHPGGNGYSDEAVLKGTGEKAAKPTPPDDEDDLPVPR